MSEWLYTLNRDAEPMQILPFTKIGHAVSSLPEALSWFAPGPL
jgi:hypothetical protein